SLAARSCHLESCKVEERFVGGDKDCVIEPGGHALGEVARFVLHARGHRDLASDRYAMSFEYQIHIAVSVQDLPFHGDFKSARRGHPPDKRLEILVLRTAAARAIGEVCPLGSS